MPPLVRAYRSWESLVDGPATGDPNQVSHESLRALRAIHLRGPLRTTDVHPHTGWKLALATGVTDRVATIECAILFLGIGIGSLVGVITGNTVLALACGAVSSYVLQLVLLPLIMLKQAVQDRHTDARAETDHEILGHQVEVLATLHEMQEEQTGILHKLQQRVFPSSTSTTGGTANVEGGSR